MLFDPFVVFSRKDPFVHCFCLGRFYFLFRFTKCLFKKKYSQKRLECPEKENQKHLGEHNLLFYSIFYRLRVDHKLRTYFCVVEKGEGVKLWDESLWFFLDPAKFLKNESLKLRNSAVLIATNCFEQMICSVWIVLSFSKTSVTFF